jgi:hypothetical protein
MIARTIVLTKFAILVKKKLVEEKVKARKMFEEELHKPSSEVPDLLALPEDGWAKDYILDQVGHNSGVNYLVYSHCLRMGENRTIF